VGKAGAKATKHWGGYVYHPSKYDLANVLEMPAMRYPTAGETVILSEDQRHQLEAMEAMVHRLYMVNNEVFLVAIEYYYKTKPNKSKCHSLCRMRECVNTNGGVRRLMDMAPEDVVMQV
jgi:hypothetical protein